MMRANWATHFGFTKLPFFEDDLGEGSGRPRLASRTVARIRFCIAESLLGAITGEVGAGKTVDVRAAISQLDHAAHTSCTWPTRPSVRAVCL